MKMRQIIGVLTLFAFSSVSLGQDIDSTGKALDTAERLYESERSGLDDEMLKLCDDREAAIRGSGDRESLKIVSVGRTRFIETGELPGWTPFEQVTGRLDSRARMIEAFDLAVKEYTKKGFIDK